MEMFCGIVIKKDEINVTVIDDRQDEVISEDIPNNAAGVIALLTPHRENLQRIVMEADQDPRWLIDALTAEGFSNVHSIS